MGLGLQDPGPDHSTISRFRTALATHGLGERLFAEVTRQLDANGWLVKAGTLLDATLVAAQARRPSMDEGPGAGSATTVDSDCIASKACIDVIACNAVTASALVTWPRLPSLQSRPAQRRR